MRLTLAGRAAAAVAACLALAGVRAEATELDLNVNDDAARLSVAWDVTGRLRADAGVLTHEDRGELVHGGILLVDNAASEAPVTAGLGGRLYYIDPDGAPDEEFALALGGFAEYVFPNADRFSVQGHVYYSPDVLAFGDLEDFVEVGARVSYNVLRDADIYIGARYLKADIDNGPEVTLDNGLIVGIQLRF